MKKHNITPYLDDESYAKALGQLRLNMAAVFEPFRMYGQEVYIEGAVSEAVRLAEDFSLRVRGVDKPISIDLIRNHRGKR